MRRPIHIVYAIAFPYCNVLTRLCRLIFEKSSIRQARTKYVPERDLIPTRPTGEKRVPPGYKRPSESHSTKSKSASHHSSKSAAASHHPSKSGAASRLSHKSGSASHLSHKSVSAARHVAAHSIAGERPRRAAAMRATTRMAGTTRRKRGASLSGRGAAARVSEALGIPLTVHEPIVEYILQPAHVATPRTSHHSKSPTAYHRIKPPTIVRRRRRGPSQGYLIPNARLKSIIQHVIHKSSPRHLQTSRGALAAIRRNTDALLALVLQDAVYSADSDNRITIRRKDIDHALKHGPLVE